MNEQVCITSTNTWSNRNYGYQAAAVVAAATTAAAATTTAAATPTTYKYKVTLPEDFLKLSLIGAPNDW